VHPRRSLGRIQIDPAHLPTLGVAKLDQHAIRIAEVVAGDGTVDPKSWWQVSRL
jgi:hypothetical protein